MRTEELRKKPEGCENKIRVLEQALSTSAMAYYYVNLSRDCMAQPLQTSGFDPGEWAELSAGSPYAELIERWTELVSPEDRPVYQDFFRSSHLKECLEQGREHPSLRYRFIDSRGKSRLIEHHVVLYREGSDVMALCYVLDQTSVEEIHSQHTQLARQHAEDQIHIEGLASQYATLYSINLDTRAYVKYQVGRDVRWENMVGPIENADDFFEVYKRAVLAYSHPDFHKDVIKFANVNYIREVLQRRKRYSFRFMYLGWDRKYFWLELVLIKLDREEEEATHIALAFLNVDEEEREKEARRQALVDALTAAERANRAKTAFLSNMSHDVRTPMNAIIGFTDIALKRDPSWEVRECLEKIQESSEHLLMLLNDVLDISRIESGKVTYEPVPVDMVEVIDTVLSITQGFLTNRQLTFRTNRSKPDYPFVMADPIRIRETLLNILSNAVKFTHDGGEITFTEEYPEGGIARYTIADTGIGMSREYLSCLFDEFTQEDRGARTQYSGTGLGMYITKRYVEMMGGSIAVESKKGEGTTVVVELPLGMTLADYMEEQASPAQLKDLEGIRVLLAEDNDMNAEIATMHLGEYGMRVTRVVDGKAAVDAFAGNPEGTFDLILMDVMMPNMNGYEATKAIRRMKNRGDAGRIPIIAMTAMAFAEDVQEALSAGMNAHIAKPLMMEEVIQIISANIQR